jgi:crotonobetainyl-CoA:carnitine CoA-transferase CaiB-like acyl-CoA transferase
MQAEAGYLHLTGEPDGPPARMGLSMVDYMTGMTTALALLAAVFGAARSGRGGDVDVSLFDVALAQLTYPATWFLNEGHAVERMPRSAHPSTVPCELVPCADGWLFVMCMTPRFWEALARGVDRSEWLTDPRFADAAARRAHRAQMSAMLEEVFRTQPVAHWMQRFEGVMPVAPVLDLPQALRSPFVARAGMIQELPHPRLPGQRVLASPVKLDGRRLPGRACSALGADTDEVLAAAGYAPEDIDSLRQQGVV